MALIDELSAALKEAMKAKDKPKLDAIRQVQTEIAKKKSEKGEEANDELVLGVISSYVKKMTKAVEEYKSLGDRGIEMAEKIQFEIDFLSGWLPEQLSEEDVAKLVDEVRSVTNNTLGDVLPKDVIRAFTGTIFSNERIKNINGKTYVVPR